MRARLGVTAREGRREIIDPVEASDIVRFARRDWNALAGLKADHWATLKARRGPDAGLLIADELRRHARETRPDWPSEQDRQDDLEVHIRVSAALRSVHAGRRS